MANSDLMTQRGSEVDGVLVSGSYLRSSWKMQLGVRASNAWASGGPVTVVSPPDTTWDTHICTHAHTRIRHRQNTQRTQTHAL